MNMKNLALFAALPLLALAGAASAGQPVALSDFQMDGITAGLTVAPGPEVVPAPDPEVAPVDPDVTPVAGLVLFKFDLIAVGGGCCGAASTQVIFDGATAPVSAVTSELSNVLHVLSTGQFVGVAVTAALPTTGVPVPNFPQPN